MKLRARSRRPSIRRLKLLSLAATVVTAMAAAAESRTSITDPIPTAAEFSARAARAGLRVFEGRHLLLATDRAAREGDGLESLPRLFDEAFETWCRHFGRRAEDHAAWQAVGCLVVDRDRFREAGLLPDVIPDFTNGFCDRSRFWMMDQSNPAYRRHLLLHEGAHAFTLTLLSLDTPAWYTEGIAEYLATHRLIEGRFIHTPIPRAASDVEQLGRIERLRALVAAGRSPSLADVFAVEPSEHRSLGPYAASWAAVAMLVGHPRHAKVFASLERGPLDASFTRRLGHRAGFDAATAGRDFAAFLEDVDYGYDFDRSMVDWAAASPLDSQTKVAVVAGRGWQHAGVSLEAGRRYSLAAAGRSRLGHVGTRPIDSGPEGISLDWYRGRPVGRLLAAQWVEEPGRPAGFRVLAEGSAAEFTAATNGPAYLRINEAPGSLPDSEGRLDVSLQPSAN